MTTPLEWYRERYQQCEKCCCYYANCEEETLEQMGPEECSNCGTCENDLGQPCRYFMPVNDDTPGQIIIDTEQRRH